MHQVLIGLGGVRTCDASICRSKHPLCTNSCKRIRSDSWGPYLRSPCQSMKAAGTAELVFASVSLLNTFEGTVE